MLILVLAPGMGNLSAGEKSYSGISSTIDRTRFTLELENDLLFLHSKNNPPIKILTKWLIPGPSYPIELWDFSKTVHSFILGPGVTGLHLSSWRDESRNWGASMQAFGSDVFLIYHEKSHRITPGLSEMGLTKHRWGAMGCLFALHNNFYLNDVNHDGFIDIGVVKEKIFCTEYTDKINDVDLMTGPKYKKFTVKWFLYSRGKWIDSKKNKALPVNIDSSIQMPLIELVKSPVDYIKERYGKIIIQHRE